MRGISRSYAAGGGNSPPTATKVDASRVSTGFTDWFMQTGYNSSVHCGLSMIPGSATKGVEMYARASGGSIYARVVTFDGDGVPSYGAEFAVQPTVTGHAYYPICMDASTVAFVQSSWDGKLQCRSATIGTTTLSALTTEVTNAGWNTYANCHLADVCRVTDDIILIVHAMSNVNIAAVAFKISTNAFGARSANTALIDSEQKYVSYDTVNNRGLVHGILGANPNFHGALGISVNTSTLAVTWAGSALTIGGSMGSQQLSGWHSPQQAIYDDADEHLVLAGYHFHRQDWDGTTYNSGHTHAPEGCSFHIGGGGCPFVLDRAAGKYALVNVVGGKITVRGMYLGAIGTGEMMFGPVVQGDGAAGGLFAAQVGPAGRICVFTHSAEGTGTHYYQRFDVL